MREIKFRAFIDNEMVYYNHPQLVCNNVAMLMQFTGLLDKNGKEVYESDIVKWIELEEPDIKSTAIVFWDKICSGFYTKDITPMNYEDCCLWMMKTVEYEVIGNKYENPELITK